MIHVLIKHGWPSNVDINICHTRNSVMLFSLSKTGIEVNFMTLRFTNASLLYDRLDELLEWKHGKTYVPKGNKRLLCFIDDVNLAQVSRVSGS